MDLHSKESWRPPSWKKSSWIWFIFNLHLCPVYQEMSHKSCPLFKTCVPDNKCVLIRPAEDISWWAKHFWNSMGQFVQKPHISIQSNQKCVECKRTVTNSDLKRWRLAITLSSQSNICAQQAYFLWNIISPSVFTVWSSELRVSKPASVLLPSSVNRFN